jgi:N-methylhydantoinase B
VPGSNSLSAVEIHQEGLRLPFVKLYRAGRPDPVVTRLIAANVRTPDQVLGDIEAQVAAAHAGARGLVAMIDRHGAQTIAAYGAALHDYAERLARAADPRHSRWHLSLRRPYRRAGRQSAAVLFRLALTVAGEEVTADWTGTAPQVRGGINAPISFCKSNVYAALRSVMGADVPNCHGYTRPIHVVAPEASVLNCTYPAPAARGITGYRIVDCVFGALAQAVPDKVAADGAGGSTLPSFSGRSTGARSCSRNA